MKTLKNRNSIVLVPLIVVVLLATGWFAWKKLSPIGLPVYGKIPSFHFQTQDGKPFDSQALSGKVWIADFFYSTCHSSCPIQTTYMSNIQKEWKDKPDLDLVSFTLDPKDDTSPVLAKYAKYYHADTDRWFFLTGDKKDLYSLALNGFKVSALDNGPSSPDTEFIHSTRLVLVDRQGNIRGYYNVLEPDDMKRIEQDLTKIL